MIKISEQQIDFIKPIYRFIDDLRKPINNESITTINKKSFLSKLILVLNSLYDFTILIIISLFFKKYNSLIFIAPNLINYESFHLQQNLDNSILINYHHTKRMVSFNGKKIYNIGIFVGILDRFTNRNEEIKKSIINANKFYSRFINRLAIEIVYIPCFYDTIGFSLIFEVNRKFRIIEIQHGAICNFFPFSIPTTFKLVDEIFVNNERTSNYLKDFLYKNTDVNIKLKDGKKELVKKNSSNTKTIILYCSSIEINGIHPVLLSFLKKSKNKNFELLIRLHPREKSNADYFRRQIDEINTPFNFDDSKECESYASQSNLFLIFTWSSIIEEDYEIGIILVMIDPFGVTRFKDIIDNQLCFYSDNLTELFEANKIL